MELNNQFDDAIEYLAFCLEEVKIDIQQLDIKKKYLVESIKKGELNLSNQCDSKNTNANLFSPTWKEKKGSELIILKQEIESLEIELEDTLVKIKSLREKEKRLNNVNDCLKQVDSNNDYYINEKSSDKCCMEHNNINLNCSKNLAIGIDVLETQERERKRIARDLHDTTVQNMTNIMQKTELCTRLIDIDSIRAKLELQTMIKTIKSTINDMRSIIYDLRPMSIDDLGLIDTVKRYIKDLNSKNLDISLKVTNEVKDVLSIINLSLFRIIQEGINNSVKHGKATSILIDLKYSDDSINLVISDNGIGFKIDDCIGVETNILSGFGLSIMKERVLLLSGEINIISDKEVGTEIFVNVPLKVHKEDYEWNR